MSRIVKKMLIIARSEPIFPFPFITSHPYISLPEAVVRRCSVKKVFSEMSQNSQENTCARVSFLVKLQAQACNFIEKRDSGTDVFL